MPIPSDEDMKRISRTVTYVERLQRSAPVAPSQQQFVTPVVQLIRVTGDPAVSGRYPAVVQDYDADADTWSDLTDADCYAIDPDGGTLAAGIYLARRWGEYSGLPVFTPTEDGGFVKVSANDTSVGYLNGKLVAGLNTRLTENNDGSNETLTVDALTEVESVTWGTDQTAYPLPTSKSVLEVTLTADVLLNSVATVEVNKLLFVRVKTGYSGGGTPYRLYLKTQDDGSGFDNGFSINPYNGYKTYLVAGEGHLFVGREVGGYGRWQSIQTIGMDIAHLGQTESLRYRNVRRVEVDTTNGLYLTQAAEGEATLRIREAQAGTYNGAVTDQAQSWTGIKQFQKYIRLPFGAYGSLGTDTATLTPADTVQFFTINPTANISVYSIAGVTGRFFILANKNSTYTITVVHDDGATGTAGGRFLCPAATNFTLSRNEMAIFWYDSDVSAYRASKFGGGSTSSSTQDGTLLIGLSGSFVEKFPVTNGEGYIVTNNEGLIVASGV